MAQGRIPLIISRFINHAFIISIKNTRIIIITPPIIFPVPNYNTKDMVIYILEHYY